MGFVSEVSLRVNLDKLYGLGATVIAQDNVAVDDFRLCADLFKVAGVALQRELNRFEQILIVLVYLLLGSLHLYFNYKSKLYYLNLRIMAENKLTPLYVKTAAQKFDFKTIFLLDLNKR